jgi:hypothetical protein
MSGYFDRKRRRTNVVRRQKWATCLVRPLTLRTLIATGVWITRVIWIIYRLSGVFRG